MAGIENFVEWKEQARGPVIMRWRDLGIVGGGGRPSSDLID
jgi:hypothetical protein